jgi:SAM-dependent methyltransferase
MFLKNYFIQLAKDVLIRLPKKLIRFFEYLGEMMRFKKHNDKRFAVAVRDLYPCLSDKLTKTPFDQHYTYHPAWAARILAKTKPEYHVDFSSILSFGSIVSAFVPIKFYDYRPADLQLSNWESGFADLNNLPFDSNSQPSVSCMHTVEHIGLGRYGDPLDPKGDLTAIEELKRILKPGGDLLFVTPVGRPRIEFNAHRVYSYEQIINYFSPFTLQEFALIPDAGGLIENAVPSLVKQQHYGCGCFWFKKNL